MTVMLKAVLLVAGGLGVHSIAGTDPAPTAAPVPVTVRLVLTTQALVGETVVVKGHCLGKDAPTVAKGTRPFSGNVWQIEEGGVAAWVIGPMPRECADGTVSITARVAQDLLPKLSPPRHLRQYLVI